VESDSARLDALWREQRPRIYALCLALLRNPADAEDAAQEAFARCAPRLAELNGNAGAFLTVVARNLCLDELRRRRRGERLAARLGADDVLDAEHEALARVVLRQAWGGLPRRDRVLLSSLFTGLSYDEIATRQGWTVEAVRSGLARARRRARLAVGAASALLLPPVAARLRALLERLQGVAVFDPSGSTAAAAVVLGLVVMAPWGSAAWAPAPAAHAAAPLAVAPALSTVGDAAPAAPAGGRTLAQATAAPRAGVAPAHAPLAALGPAASRQEAGNFYAVTPAPGDPQGGTVYASGSTATCLACPVLWRSSDGGRTWGRLPAAGFTGGSVMATPAGVHALYTVADIPTEVPALQRSDDGGAHFTTLLPGATAAAFDPTAPAADPQIVAAVLGRLVRFDTALGVAVPFGSPQLAAGSIQAVAWAGDRLLLVDDQTLSGLSTVLDCDATATTCSTALSLPSTEVLRLAVSPTEAADHTVIAWAADAVYTSTDGGGSFRRTSTVASPYTVDWLAFDATAGAARVALGEWGAAAGQALTTRTLVGSTSSLDDVSFGLPSTVPLHTIAFLPDGVMVASLAGADSAGDLGLRCSTDHGVTWQHAC